MARLAAENKVAEMNGLLNTTLKHLSLVVPLSILIMVLRYEVIVMLYQRGRFDADATALTARILVFLMVGAFAFAAQTVVVRGFYAVQNTLLPAVLCTVAVLLSLPFYVVGMKFWGAAGVALAISLSAVIQVMMLFVIWNRRSRNRESRGVYHAFGKMVLFSIPTGVVLYGFRNVAAGWVDVSTFSGSLAVSLLTGSLLLFFMAAGGYLLKIDAISFGLNRIARRIVRG
jgi:putative peptidoglycan lipid II flippase